MLICTQYTYIFYSLIGKIQYRPARIRTHTHTHTHIHNTHKTELCRTPTKPYSANNVHTLYIRTGRQLHCAPRAFTNKLYMIHLFVQTLSNWQCAWYAPNIANDNIVVACVQSSVIGFKIK